MPTQNVLIVNFHFELSTPSMQNRLRVTAGLVHSFEDQVRGRLKCNAVREIRRHWLVTRGIILSIDNSCHSLQSLQDLVLVTNAVVNPVRNVLARNTQCRPIFHQPNIVNIRDLGKIILRDFIIIHIQLYNKTA